MARPGGGIRHGIASPSTTVRGRLSARAPADQPGHDIFGVFADGDLNRRSDRQRISDAGRVEPDRRNARTPAVAATRGSDGVFVVWQADDAAAGLAQTEDEIFAQRLVAPQLANGFETGNTSGWSDTVGGPW